VLYIPSNWGHATWNLCETVAVAREIGCLDDHLFEKIVIMPAMQTYGSQVTPRPTGLEHWLN